MVKNTYKADIGLEVHVELATRSKMFCSCAVVDTTTSAPNSSVCEVCCGMPGVLPVINRNAVELAMKAALALNCTVVETSIFARKNYFYPDLPKGYQISQYDLPIAYGGYLTIAPGRDIGIVRVHLEEDTGKSGHVSAHHSVVDFNRAGAPLVEMVSEPVLRDAKEAKQFCQNFQQILRYLKISEANMDQGQMRCEANISLQAKDKWEYVDGQIKPKDDYELNHKVEIKNINSFRAVEKAINYEIKRQTELLDKGKPILAETRGWNEAEGKTKEQRVKETASDYRYFPEPDIPPLVISNAMLKKVSANLVELPQAKTERFRAEYNLSAYDAEVLTFDQNFANYTEEVFSELRAWVEVDKGGWEQHKTALAKLASNWLTSELMKHMKINRQNIKEVKITPENFAELITLLFEAKINSSAGQIILNQMYQVGGDPSNIMDKLNLQQLDNDEELTKTITEVVKDNPKQVKEYLSGKQSVMKFLIGKAMAAAAGKANPKNLPAIIKKIIDSLKK